MGYVVDTIRGEVVILAGNLDAGLAAVRDMDREDDLKTGWSKVEDADGTVRRRPHWAYTDPYAIESAQTLEDMLRAFRYEVWAEESDGEIYGVHFKGWSMGNDYDLWRTLAPFIEAGSYIVWLGEDDRLERWSFDGQTMTCTPGRMVFDDNEGTNSDDWRPFAGEGNLAGRLAARMGDAERVRRRRR